MGLMKKLFWDTSPAVIIAKKAKDVQKNKQADNSGVSREQLDAKEAQAKAVKQAEKDRKKLSIGGAYYSSHSAIHNYAFLSLEFGQDGVYVVAKKDTVKAFGWNEVVSFEKETEEKNDLRHSQRVTATRLVAGGVFALAAPKSNTKGSIGSKFYYVLHTTSGDIELEYNINSGSGGGSMGEMNRNITKMMLNKQEAVANNIRRFVAEHATGKPVQASQAQPTSSADELERYAQLKEKGVITETEFEAKKKTLLNL